MIRIDNIRKAFGRFAALDDVSLTVPAGESLALWGANGAGKSTLIRCVLGLYGFEGSVSICGIDVKRRAKAARSLIGYVPQEIGFYDDLRVGEAVGLFARLRGLAGRRANIEAALAGVELIGQECKRVRELSGGMKQRLALAIALLGDPPVLVLDEVTASLDAVGREGFVSMLSSLRAGGRTMLFASHRPEEVCALGGQVAIMSRGRIERVCSPADLFAAHATTRTLKLRLRQPEAQQALGVLTAGGFDARLNCVGVLVRVDESLKAAPMRLLTQANIPFEDFELLASEHPAATTGGHS